MGTTLLNLIGPQGLSAIVDEEDYKTLDLGSYKWYPLFGRTTIYAKSHKNKKTIYLHRFIIGLIDSARSVYVDHIDHNGLNNSRTNLRITDNKGNQRNSYKRISTKNSSSYKGVRKECFDHRLKPWRAQIILSHKIKYLGNYKTEEEAALSYNKAAIEHFGDMANLNIIRPKRFFRKSLTID